MFAEEARGNQTRKRQEEARARRRQLKQQQQKKQQSRTADGSPTSVSSSATAAATTTAKPAITTTTIESSNLAVPSTEQSAAKPSAVAAALQQRQIRQEQQLKQKAALTLQSFYRAHRSNTRLLAEQASLLSQRLKDLETLRTLIFQKTNADYIPPPATATVLVRQLLFVTKSIPYKRNGLRGTHVTLRAPADDSVRVQQVLKYVLTPGILGKDDNLDPILTWLDGTVGRTRLMELLRLCFVTLTQKSVQSVSTMSAMDSFLRAVLGIPSGTSKFARGPIVEQCRIILPSFYLVDSTLSPLPVLDKKNMQPPPFAETGSDLDLLQITRYQLLFGAGKPIPNDAEKRRETCIPSSLRERNDVLFQLTLDAVQTAGAGSERRRLQSRFVADILTIPLLSWKVSIASISQLLALGSSGRPVFLVMIGSIVQEHAASLSAGQIALVLLNDVPMTVCPATSVQCLLANLIQIGRICPSINGSDVSKVNYQDAAFFFDFISILVDAVPLGTFSSRESAVEWISDGDHHTPIVLSSVICDQCKLLVVDSFVRNLFNCAIDEDALGVQDVLRSKNDKDMKHEKEMSEFGTSSATSLAASEAKVDRNKSFWKSSKWARKLSSGMSKMLPKDDSSATRNNTASMGDGGQGMLIDTSSVSRKLAHGKGPHDRNVTNAILANDDANLHAIAIESSITAPKAAYSPVFLLALCRVYAIVLARWGGGGRVDITKVSQWETPMSNREREDRKAQATATADPLMRMLLNVLCFSTPLVEASWALTQSNPGVISDLYSVIDANRSALPIRSMTIRPTYNASVGTRVGNDNTGEAVLLLFVSCLSHSLIITDDAEIHEMDKPLPLHHLRRCIQLLKKLLYRACCVDDSSATSDSNYFGLALISSSSRTMRDLYDRSSRRPLCIPKAWLVDDLLDKELKQCKTASQYTSLLATPVLRVCPFLVSFKRRLKLFERIVTLNRIEIQGLNDQNPFNSNPLKPGIPVRIMRTRLLEDGLATLNNLGSNMRQRIVVHYTNEAGRQETGIDAGGLFKEFWTDLSQLAFDPNYALFRVTEDNCLYPNPSSFAAHGSDHIVLFEFLGRILGKSLFEGITVHPQFAHFFLSFMRGDYNFLHQFSDLSTMDVQLYNNLMFLKTYEGDAEELCLTFTVANDDFGGKKEIALIPNGADIPVTNANKHRYIGLVAKHHVCDRVKVQSEAFRRGLWEVIDRSWLRIFNEPELQVLISGPSDGKIDIADMRANSRYAGGYTPIDRNIKFFWSVVGSMSREHQAALLRFVTSCERPPPLGFATLNPPFTIQRVGIFRDGDKLPTASTCFNVLKLPTYSSEKVLRQRLIYAIESGAGFELT